MEFRFGCLADWAGAGAGGKLIILGIFDLAFDLLQVEPVRLPPSYLVAIFDARTAEGTHHQCTITFQDMDGHDLMPPTTGPVQFVPQGPGLVMRASMVVPLFGLLVPKRGEYAFRFHEGDRYLGSIPFRIVAPPGQ